MRVPRKANAAAGLLAGLIACAGEPPISPPTQDLVPTSLLVSPAALDFGALGRQVPLQVLVRNAAGDTLPDVPITWTHVRVGVTTVSTAGLVTALANGVDTIIAMADTLADSVAVIVSQVPVSLTVGASQTTLSVLGTTVLLDASVVDSNSRVVPGQAVTWTSDNAVALPVDSTGRVTAARLGSARITAASGSMSRSLTISVVISGPIGGPLTGAVVPCTGGSAGPFPCSGVDLLAYLPIGALGGGAGIDLNDLWGWTDPVTGTEWALVLRRDGTSFVSLEDPLNPAFVGFLPIPNGANPNFWHDVKVYADHAFIVADGAGQHGMQVFDLTQLRSVTGPPVTFTATTRYTGVASVHNIAINEATGYAYLVGANGGGTTCGGALHMVNIQAPASPMFAGCFADPLTGRGSTGYTHDVQCVIYAGPDAAYTGREICVGANETHVSIADVTDKSAPVAISRANYPSVGYTHQGWLTPDQRYFYVNDELDEAMGTVATTRTLIWDVADLGDPLLVGQYFGPTPAIDHNHYVAGTRLFASNYQYGIRVLDISDPLNPAQIGRFDTAPNEANVPGFGGSWSNYPFFASGIVVVTSGAQGLFVLRVP